MADVVQRVALAIERADKARDIPEGVVDHPDVSSWGEHLARAAIAETLDVVAAHLSAVKYGPAPYTAMKARLTAMRKEALGA